ncbi:hypothetical protein [Pararobbsia silviterrae]|uniref:hypothetical protein n=1 Tax=Pararobbsia silviterrae TaxID=1792498 RepID=UPI0011C38F66|nr:hypothetical protein [Pararobbsia silviterrae]
MYQVYVRDRDDPDLAIEEAVLSPIGAQVTGWSPAQNPLFSLPNCLVTPRVAYVSEDALDEACRTAAESVRAVLLGQTLPNLVSPRR